MNDTDFKKLAARYDWRYEEDKDSLRFHSFLNILSWSTWGVIFLTGIAVIIEILVLSQWEWTLMHIFLFVLCGAVSLLCIHWFFAQMFNYVIIDRSQIHFMFGLRKRSLLLSNGLRFRVAFEDTESTTQHVTNYYRESHITLASSEGDFTLISLTALRDKSTDVNILTHEIARRLKLRITETLASSNSK